MRYFDSVMVTDGGESLPFSGVSEGRDLVTEYMNLGTCFLRSRVSHPENRGGIHATGKGYCDNSLGYLRSGRFRFCLCHVFPLLRLSVAFVGLPGLLNAALASFVREKPPGTRSSSGRSACPASSAQIPLRIHGISTRQQSERAREFVPACGILLRNTSHPYSRSIDDHTNHMSLRCGSAAYVHVGHFQVMRSVQVPATASLRSPRPDHPRYRVPRTGPAVSGAVCLPRSSDRECIHH